MKERRRPSDLNEETRGVGAGELRSDELDMRVIVDGVRADSVGEGGKTKSVCAGVADGGAWCWRKDFLSAEAGLPGARETARCGSGL
jgi:hypothetical protein